MTMMVMTMVADDDDNEVDGNRAMGGDDGDGATGDNKWRRRVGDGATG